MPDAVVSRWILAVAGLVVMLEDKIDEPGVLSPAVSTALRRVSPGNGCGSGDSAMEG